MISPNPKADNPIFKPPCNTLWSPLFSFPKLFKTLFLNEVLFELGKLFTVVEFLISLNGDIVFELILLISIIPFFILLELLII